MNKPLNFLAFVVLAISSKIADGIDAENVNIIEEYPPPSVLTHQTNHLRENERAF